MRKGVRSRRADADLNAVVSSEFSSEFIRVCWTAGRHRKDIRTTEDSFLAGKSEFFFLCAPEVTVAELQR